MKVHAIRLAEAPARGSFVQEGGSRRDRIPLTVGVLLVDHPQGRVLVDAGLPEAAGVADRVAATLLTGQLRPGHRRLTDALRDEGIEPESVTDVVLTHLHWDHTGAVTAFRGARLLVGPGELAAASGRLAQSTKYLGAARVMRGGVGEVDLHGFDEGGAVFPRAHDLFGDGAVVLLPTPGHTPGSLSVLLRTDPPLLHIGDAAYCMDSLRRGLRNGRLLGRPVDADPGLARHTLGRLAELEGRLGARLLPAHDTDEWARLPAFPDAL